MIKIEIILTGDLLFFYIVLKPPTHDSRGPDQLYNCLTQLE